MRLSVPDSRESRLIEAVFADRNCHVTLKSVDGRYLKFNSIDEFDSLLTFIEDTLPPYDAIWKARDYDDRNRSDVIDGVAHLRRMPAELSAGWLSNPGHIYVGDASGGFERSPWAFDDRLDDPAMAAAQYENHVTSSEELSSLLGSLRGKTLGCCCDAEDNCYALVLKKLIGEA